jgi:hypothetical protein
LRDRTPTSPGVDQGIDIPCKPRLLERKPAMKATHPLLRWLALAGCVCSLALGTASLRAQEVLYVGDAGNNTVKRYDAVTGTFLGELSTSAHDPINGPHGVVSDGTTLLLVNQNVLKNIPGEVVRLDKAGLVDFSPLVASDNPNAPAVPVGGVLLWQGNVYVSNFTTTLDPNTPPNQLAQGQILKFTAAGDFDGEFDIPPLALIGGFHPRGMVIIGNLLYVANDPNPGQTAGHILRFIPASRQFYDVFFTSRGGGTCNCADEVNRPDGIVHGPDGNIYMTSFRDALVPRDTDKIVVIEGPGSQHSGTFLRHIELWHDPQPRAFAQALLFGPGGDLFVPISNTGGLRRYVISDGSFTQFIEDPTGGGNPNNRTPNPSAKKKLAAGQYLTFDSTDPGTLSFGKP